MYFMVVKFRLIKFTHRNNLFIFNNLANKITMLCQAFRHGTELQMSGQAQSAFAKISHSFAKYLY